MSGIETVMGVLEDHRFQRHPYPLEVAGTTFPFEGAAVGQRPLHDLVLVAGTKLPVARLVRMLTSVARRLDVHSSRRPITLVLVGPSAVPVIRELERVARVLRVPENPTREDVKDALAVLLPLDAALGVASREINALDEVSKHVAKWRPEWDAFLEAAQHGQAAVEDHLARYVNSGANPQATEGDIDG